MKRMLGIIAAIVAVMVMALPLAACGDSSKTQSELDLLKETIEELTDRLDELTTENGELTDKIEALNVFTSDKAEYGERETMTVYFKNVPVLKIRISFNNIYGTAFWGGSSLNHTLYITSLCADINVATIVDSSLAVSDVGAFARAYSEGTRVIKQNQETAISGYFKCANEAYDSSTWFGIAICVPGTPFELARFKNLSHQG